MCVCMNDCLKCTVIWSIVFGIWCMYYFCSVFDECFPLNLIVLSVVCGSLRLVDFDALMLCVFWPSWLLTFIYCLVTIMFLFKIAFNSMPQLKSEWWFCVVIVLHELIYLNFLFHCRVLAQIPKISSFVWHICSLQYLSTQGLLDCLMLQQLLASFQEDCVQYVRNKFHLLLLSM